MGRLPVLDPITPAEREWLRALRTSTARGTPPPALLETTVVRPDGTSVPLEVAVSYTRDDGRLLSFAFMRDLSTSADMARALRESEERFRNLAETSPTHRRLFLGAGRLRQPGGAAAPRDRFEEGSHAVRSRSLRDTGAPRSRRRVPGAREEGRAAPSPSPIRITGPDEQELVLETSLSLVTLNGEPALFSYTRDITERMRMQAELVNKDRLASVGMLAAGVAHELNNPLASLGMQVRRLRTDADKQGFSEAVKTSLAQIDEAAGRMNTIIADLLFMARPVDQPQAHVDVAQILTSTIALLRAGLERCPGIMHDIATLPPIRGYTSKLGQVFLNILRNAVQAVEDRPDGKVQRHRASGGQLARGRVPGQRRGDPQRSDAPRDATILLDEAYGYGPRALDQPDARRAAQRRAGGVERPWRRHDGDGAVASRSSPLRVMTSLNSGTPEAIRAFAADIIDTAYFVRSPP